MVFAFIRLNHGDTTGQKRSQSGWGYFSLPNGPYRAAPRRAALPRGKARMASPVEEFPDPQISFSIPRSALGRCGIP
jgi:hypothetical protein